MRTCDGVSSFPYRINDFSILKFDPGFFFDKNNRERERNKINRSFNKFPGILSDSFWSSEVNQLSIRSVSSIKYFIKNDLIKLRLETY